MRRVPVLQVASITCRDEEDRGTVTRPGPGRTLAPPPWARGLISPMSRAVHDGSRPEDDASGNNSVTYSR